jgi:hypothetical protein
MHKSRLKGIVLDCHDADPAAAAHFWSAALGMKSLGASGQRYVRLDASARGLNVAVQAVDHESRIHLDIETDDVDAEAARLEALGARRIAKVKTWWVMESPTGQRFCVGQAKDLSAATDVNTW